MASDTWGVRPLDDVGVLVMGNSPAGTSYNDEGKGAPLLNGPTEFGPVHPTPVLFTTEPSRWAERGDLLFCVRGSTTGRMNRADQRYCVGRGVAAIRAESGDESDTRFIEMAIRAQLPALLQHATGSTFPSLSGPTLRSMKVPWPDPLCRAGAAAVLGMLEQKIESNRTIARKSRALSATLYERAVLDDGTTESVADIVTFHNRERVPLSAAQRAERAGEIPYYGATGVFGHVDDYLFDEPLLLVGEDGTVVNPDGTPVIQYIWGKAWVNNHAHVLTGTRLSTEAAVLAIQRADVRPLVTGAVQAKISMRNLKALKVEVPSEGRLSPTEAIVQPLFQQLRALMDEARTLTAIREALLPKLVSGKIRVPLSDDPEEQVGATVEALSG